MTESVRNEKTTRVRVILVGGFLGAGKTTLLRQAGRRLAARGLRVGLVTNDQAENLVDTETLRREGFGVEEVAGGCFCCRFRDLVACGARLLERHAPDVLLCEPVGSCTDLAATVLRPLKQFLGSRYDVAPYSVLVDPLRLRELLEPGPRPPFSEKVRYIYSKQLEEADRIVLNKADLLPAEELDELRAGLLKAFPRAEVRALSAHAGEGLDAWLDEMFVEAPAGRRGIHVDYDVYAEGEAELGWLNAAARLRSAVPVAWKPKMLDLLRNLKDRFAAAGAEVAHVKLSLTAPGHALVGNLTSSRGQPFLLVQGTSEEPSDEAYLILNARVHMAPEDLEPAVREALEACAREGLNSKLERLECFRPGRPVPEHRIAPSEDCVVGAENPCQILRDVFKPKRK
ncbi:MAG: cobalamin biosynthesis protein P47K [Planctomycetota bacterium]|nr:cobalamin biosynthesis protein P47K [Planctomycetota bacterium]